MNKNVLLIFPKTGLDLQNINIQMPMGLMCLAASLIKKGYNGVILDQRVEKDFYKKIKYYLCDKPICVGISVMTGSQILYALKIANFIRNNNAEVKIVWGGNHPSLMPEQTLQNETVDIVVRGEGEITFTEIVNNLFLKKKLKEIKGISFKDENIICHNSEREFCDLSELPRVDYSLIDIEKYIFSQVPGRKRSLDVYTSRGCPYNCIFCYNKSFNKSSYRIKDINMVIQEIDFLVKKYNLDSIYINDDNFFVDIKRIEYFCEYLSKKKIITEWGCQGVRIDALEKIDFSLLEKSRCRHLYIGIESGSEKILNYINKQITVPQIKKIVNKFANSSIIAHYNFMIGYPIETREDLFQTIDLVDYIRQVDPKAYFSSFHLITPYPGTEFYDIAQKHGFKTPSNLKGWANIRWEFDDIAWISPKMRSLYINLTYITYFIDHKVLVRTNKNIFLKIFTKMMIILAKFHWKHRKLKFCPEFKLLNKIINIKIAKDTRICKHQN
ncbi:MAG: B12-binding domain-containing radical SAM protein [Candidatus Omnitrophica bacterium]|nr:B12-binding domain-containing radical SAM protein [Candidatus Omnitrophota bacterium]